MMPHRLGPPLVALLALLGLVIVVSVMVGAESVRMRALLDGAATDRVIIMEIRLPRVLTAAAVGAILAIAGATFQTLLRNPLADPFILGVSGGAACAAATASLLGIGRSSAVLALAAFAGAAATTMVVTALASRRGQLDTVRLVISGLVLNSFFSAVILLVISFARGADLVMALRWMIGTLALVGWREAAVSAFALAVTLVVLMTVAGDLRMLIFGEEDARARGVDVDRLKRIGFICASLATGAAVAVTGIIGFVGVLVPHIVRLIWRADYRVELPVAALAGAVLLVASDTVSRVIVAPGELPVGAFLALLGVPFFVVLLRREH